MILSKSCIYGIQATIHVAAAKGDSYVTISNIAEQLNISFHFLTKVLQHFTSAGILQSYRGPKGGVTLKIPAEEISLYSLIEAVDGTNVFTECMLGLPGCGVAAPCPAHDHWVEVRNRFTEIARSVSLAELANTANELNVRISSANINSIASSTVDQGGH